MTNAVTEIFRLRYPGPYDYQNGTDGVDATFDIFCCLSGNHIASIFYWDDRLTSELTARIITWVLNAKHPDFRGNGLFDIDPLSAREIDAFLRMHPGPYHASASNCEYRGFGYRVVCESSGETVVFICDRSFLGQARLVSKELALALEVVKKLKPRP